MLNCIVPRGILCAIERRFGNVFSSIAPDFCFAYRCLEIVDSILFFDKAPLIHYSTSRSTGEGYMRGISSQDTSDFLASVSSTGMNFATPVPEFHTVMNSVLHEYCTVRAETKSKKFPEVDWFNYLGTMDRGISPIRNQKLAAEMRELLRKKGWTVSARCAWWTLKFGALITRYPIGAWRQAMMFMFASAPTKPAWMFFARFGLRPPASRWFGFESSTEAIEFATMFPRRRSSGLGHLWRLMEPIDSSTRAAVREAPSGPTRSGGTVPR
jgi:hypothetical protein